MKIRRKPLLCGGLIAIMTAVAHALIGQAHLIQVLNADIDDVDRAVMFAVWHMVTSILVTSGIGLFTLSMSTRFELVRPMSLALAFLYCSFGLIFLLASFIYTVPAVQWIPMLIVCVLCLLGSGK